MKRQFLCHSKVRGIAEEEIFKVVKTGKKTAKKGISICCPKQDRTIANQSLGWKRMITKPTFVGPDFTRRPVK
jgi:ribosome biogenesis protein NSA2